MNKKFGITLVLLLGSIFCASCNKTNNIENNNKQEETIEEKQEEDTPIIPEDLSEPELKDREKFIVYYYNFLNNFDKTNVKTLSSYSGTVTVKGTVCSLSSCTINSEDNYYVANITFASSDSTITGSATFPVINYDLDLMLATKDSFIVYNKNFIPAYKLSDDEISCYCTLKDSTEIESEMSYDNETYLTRFKGITFNCTVNNASSIINADLTFTWAE